MFSAASLLLTTTATFTLLATTLIALQLQRQRMKRRAFAAIMQPQSVEHAWVSPPDAEGLRRLFVKTANDQKARTIAMDFEVDEIVRRLSAAGVRVGYEREMRA